MAATTAIVVAAGSGDRLRRDVSKAFVPVAGEPLFVHALRSFAACDAVDHLLAVVAEGEQARAATALDTAGLHGVTVCVGGASRADSVARGLAACPAPTTVVAVHDAARPLVPVDLIARTLDGLEDPWVAVAPAMPVVDTLKLVDEEHGTVVRTVDRQGLYGVQTPQVFSRDVLAEAHERARDAEPTDDLLLVEQTGGRVRVVPGDRKNLKVTYPEDLPLVEALLAAQHGTAPGGGP